MKQAIKYSAVIASFILVLPYMAYADTGSATPHASQMLQIQMASMTCRNTHTAGYIGDVVTAINNATVTATTSTDLTKLGNDFSALQSDANGSNAAQFKADSKTYNIDSRTVNLDARAAIKTVHSKSVNAELKSDATPLKSAYNSCLFGVKHQYAQLKMQMFTSALLHAKNMTKKMSERGMNTTALNQTIGMAGGQIQSFEAAVNNAQNSTQLKAALDSFCLYNGCKNPDNFHFAAKTAIDSAQAKIRFLAGKNSTSSYQTLVSQAQADLGNAQTALSQVGSSKYQGTQSSDVWNNIKGAVDIIHQLQHLASHKH